MRANKYKHPWRRHGRPASIPPEWPEKPIAPSWNSGLLSLQPQAKRARSTDSLGSAEGRGGYHPSVQDIGKAACLLSRPQEPTEFEDEGEMRRIYSLIYDVFRYKAVLNSCVDDVAFFVINPEDSIDGFPIRSVFDENRPHCCIKEWMEMLDSPNLLWLLLYDLYMRRFRPRSSLLDRDEDATITFPPGLSDIDDCLWANRVSLAAAVARVRIKHQVLDLTKLLPVRLRDDRIVALNRSYVTGWINTFIVKGDSLEKEIEGDGLKPMAIKQNVVHMNCYKFDHLCPRFIICHPKQRKSLAQSALVKEYRLVLQDRAFCLGPAVLCKTILEQELTGYVALSHINSPRTAAYLANLLADNQKVDGLIAFGAGDRKAEYEEYMEQLGVNNMQLVADRFVDTSPDSHLLCGVVAVLASPPNTYSGVLDPIDLVVSRGGDLAMLEVLTDGELGATSRDSVNLILEEQRQTLRKCMCRPQVQVVMYETHSIVPAENRDMVVDLINEINVKAKEHYLEDSNKHSAFHSAKTEPASQRAESKLEQHKAEDLDLLAVDSMLNGDDEKMLAQALDEEGEEMLAEEAESTESEEEKEEITPDEKKMTAFERRTANSIDLEQEIKQHVEKRLIHHFPGFDIPQCDLFTIGDMPDLCPNGDQCLNLEEEGCYLALVRRKELIRLDAKYMINIAESRGLFGSEEKKTPSGRTRKRNGEESSRSGSGQSVTQKCGIRRCKVEMDRIAAPTQASLLRSSLSNNYDAALLVCQRHQHHQQEAYRDCNASGSHRSSSTSRDDFHTYAQQVAAVRRLAVPVARRTPTKKEIQISEFMPNSPLSVSDECTTDLSVLNITYNGENSSSPDLLGIVAKKLAKKRDIIANISPTTGEEERRVQNSSRGKDVEKDSPTRHPRNQFTPIGSPDKKRGESPPPSRGAPRPKEIKKLLQRKERDPSYLDPSLFEDEAWFYDYKPESKTGAAEEKAMRSRSPTKAHRQQWEAAKFSEVVAPLVELVRGKMLHQKTQDNSIGRKRAWRRNKFDEQGSPPLSGSQLLDPEVRRNIAEAGRRKKDAAVLTKRHAGGFTLQAVQLPNELGRRTKGVRKRAGNETEAGLSTAFKNIEEENEIHENAVRVPIFMDDTDYSSEDDEVVNDVGALKIRKPLQKDTPKPSASLGGFRDYDEM